MVPMITPADPIDREIGYMPTKAPYDPRWMLGGRQNPCKFPYLCCSVHLGHVYLLYQDLHSSCLFYFQ